MKVQKESIYEEFNDLFGIPGHPCYFQQQQQQQQQQQLKQQLKQGGRLESFRHK